MTSTRYTAIGVVGALSLLATPPAAAQSQTVAQIRAVCVRFACTPAQFREVVAFYDSNAARITDLARTNRVNQTAFRAMSIELGVRYRASDPQAILRAIETRVADAVRFERENATLRQQLAAVTDAAIRTPVEALLARADAAYAAGDLDGAQALFEQLITLRGSDLNSAADAWEAANRAAINLARARGDIAAIDRLAAQAQAARAQRLQQQANASRRANWLDQMERAAARYDVGLTLGDTAALVDAIQIYRQDALTFAPRDTAADDWAVTQNDLGVALWSLGERESGPARLEEAVAAYRLALEVRTRTRPRVPIEWARTQQNLGLALQSLGQRRGATALLEEAVAAYRLALEETPRAQQPFEWAATQQNLGNALTILGVSESGTAHLQDAVVALRLALEERPRARMPTGWATTQQNLGNALTWLGERENGIERLTEAVSALRLSLEELSRERQPLEWASTQQNLATALLIVSQRSSSPSRASILEAWSALNMSTGVSRRLNHVPLNARGQQIARFLLDLARQRGWSLPDMRSQGGNAGTAKP